MRDMNQMGNGIDQDLTGYTYTEPQPYDAYWNVSFSSGSRTKKEV